MSQDKELEEDFYEDEKYEDPVYDDLEEYQDSFTHAGKSESVEEIDVERTEKVSEEENSIKEDQEEQPKESEDELTNSEYIAVKKREYFRQDGATDEGWHQLRAQINSGLYLGIKQARIDLYSRADLTYEQREILKFYLYDGIDIKAINQATEYSAAEMIIYLAGYKSENNLVTAISKNVSALDASIQQYRADVESISSDMEKKIEEYKIKIQELEKELLEKDKIISEKTSAYDNLIKTQKKAARDVERQKVYKRDVEAAAMRLFSKKQLEEELKREQEREIEERVRQEYEGKAPKGKSFRFFSRKNRGEVTEPIKQQQVHLVPEELPKNFDLPVYIMNSSLSSSQYDVIALAVQAQVDDSIIKQMIDRNLPAAQMKQILSVILTKREFENRKMNNNSSEEEEDYEGELNEEDLEYDEL